MPASLILERIKNKVVFGIRTPHFLQCSSFIDSPTHVTLWRKSDHFCIHKNSFSIQNYKKFLRVRHFYDMDAEFYSENHLNSSRILFNAFRFFKLPTIFFPSLFHFFPEKSFALSIPNEHVPNPWLDFHLSNVELSTSYFSTPLICTPIFLFVFLLALTRHPAILLNLQLHSFFGYTNSFGNELPYPLVDEDTKKKKRADSITVFNKLFKSLLNSSRFSDSVFEFKNGKKYAVDNELNKKESNESNEFNKIESKESNESKLTIPNKIMNEISEKESSNSMQTLVLGAIEKALGGSIGKNSIVSAPSPLVIIISGPSGVGKDAVIKRLQELRSDLHFVVTATTRKMRVGEVEGKDYFFLSKPCFLEMIEKKELLEHAIVYGEYKGIPRQQVRDSMARGTDVVLRLDVQGAATVRNILGKNGVFIFLLPESEISLVRRLVERKTESMENILIRIGTAREEIGRLKEFDYAVVNADGELDKTVAMICSIIDAEKSKIDRKVPEL